MRKQTVVLITKVVTATAPLLLAGSVGAATDAEIYHGFADGNPDISTEIEGVSTATSVQPGVGDRFDSYRDWAKGNPDLYSSVGVRPDRSDRTPSADLDIYHGFGEGNPDL
jgi:hypothetical protein